MTLEMHYQEKYEEGLEEGRAEGRAEGRVEGSVKTLIALVKKGKLTISEAAEEAEMTEKEFYAKIDHSLQQAAEGKVYRSMPGESADAFLDRLIAMGD